LLIQQAEEFHKAAHQLLDWLADTERSLRYQSAVVPETEELISEQLEQQEVRISSNKLGSGIFSLSG
jgi:hypothetical protein